MSAKDIYDFEGVVESAGKAVLTDLGLTAATSQDAQDFQKSRPRIELLCTMGAGADRPVVVLAGAVATPDTVVASGLTPRELFRKRRESAWSFNLKLMLITAANITAHTEYRAEVRAMLAEFWNLLNGVSLTRHAIEMRRDAGTVGILVEPEQGIYRTDLSFDGLISIQGNAWGAVDTDGDLIQWKMLGSLWRRDINDPTHVEAYDESDQKWHRVWVEDGTIAIDQNGSST